MVGDVEGALVTAEDEERESGCHRGRVRNDERREGD